ncbi:MAG: hypothetical protein KKD32_06995 [Proteobacteria bacterium]|nr:hypothetical protein [Pseudomonadota bacterium]
MGIEEKIFEIQLKRGVFETAEVDFAAGLAQLAIDKGYASLSNRQRAILEPYLSVPCSGVTDPGGYHNDCSVLLEGKKLLEAYEQSFDSDSLMCEDCRGEEGYYEYQWQKISEE